MQSTSIKKLIDLFSKFPAVGPRTAARFVFYLLKMPKEEIDALVFSIQELKNNVKTCEFCFDCFEEDSSSPINGSNICEICRDPKRDKSLLCVVEKETDLLSLEKTRKYHGLFFILGGTISTLRKDDIKKLRMAELTERLKGNPEIKEIIIAINPTAEGEATALYIERLLNSFGKKITRLGRGLPMGAELEYADEETLSSAIEGRK